METLSTLLPSFAHSTFLSILLKELSLPKSVGEGTLSLLRLTLGAEKSGERGKGFQLSADNSAFLFVLLTLSEEKEDRRLDALTLRNTEVASALLCSGRRQPYFSVEEDG